jgi:general stress protein 26
MTPPTATALDPRFSDPGTTPTSWDDTRAVLDGAQLSWITTVRADGRPHVTPLVAVWLDDTAYFCTGADEQKAVNLSGNPNVVLTTGCNTWDEGVDVMIEGRAVRATDQALLEQLARAWAEKWDGSWHFEAGDGVFHHEGGAGVALVFAIEASKVLAFAKAPFSHTRHRF